MVDVAAISSVGAPTLTVTDQTLANAIEVTGIYTGHLVGYYMVRIESQWTDANKTFRWQACLSDIYDPTNQPECPFSVNENWDDCVPGSFRCVAQSGVPVVASQPTPLGADGINVTFSQFQQLEASIGRWKFDVLVTNPVGVRNAADEVTLAIGQDGSLFGLGGDTVSGVLTSEHLLNVQSGGVTVEADGATVLGGVNILDTGLNVSSGGITVQAGGMSVTGGVTVHSSTLGGGAALVVESDGINIAGGGTVSGGMTLHDGLTVSTGQLAVLSGETVISDGLHVSNSDFTVAGGTSTFHGGVVVDNVGLAVVEGGITVETDGANISGGINVNTGMTISSGGLSIQGGSNGTLAINHDPSASTSSMVSVQSLSSANLTGYVGIPSMSSDMALDSQTHYTGHTEGYYEVHIAIIGETDQFKWRKVVNNTVGTFSPPIFITVNTAQLLAENIWIMFDTNTGHQLNGQPSGVWTIAVDAVNPLAIYDSNGDLSLTIGQDGTLHTEGGISVGGGLTLVDSGIVIHDTLEITNGGLFVEAGGASIKGDLAIHDGGVTVVEGGMNVSSGDLDVLNGSMTIKSGINVTQGGVHVDAGGVNVTAGGLRVSAGGLEIQSGGLTVVDGGLNIESGGVDMQDGAVIASGLIVESGGATINLGSLDVENGGLLVQSGGLAVAHGISLHNQGLDIVRGGLQVIEGGAIISAGGLTVSASGGTIGLEVMSGGASVAGGVDVSGGLNVLEKGINITSGALRVLHGTAELGGGLTVDQGLTVASGGATVSGNVVVADGGMNVSAGGVTVLGGGRVGINQASPEYLLDIQSDSSIGSVVFFGSDPDHNDMIVAPDSIYVGVTGGTFHVEISSTGNGVDTFKWRKCAQQLSCAQDANPSCATSDIWSQASGITGGAQALYEGVAIKFGATTGHNASSATLDNWCFTVDSTNPIGFRDA
eukprot:COSAG05_NODE_2637_length_2815_cov_1.801915_1_plen_938_part_11